MCNTLYTINPANFAYISTSDIYGGQSVSIDISPDLIQDLEWLREFRLKHEYESMLRDRNPALKSTWDSYQTMLKLVRND
jgi:hypothetical protein